MRFYLDHNACTPVDPRVVERFQQVESDCPGNPGSPHASGRKARAALENARDVIASCFGIPSDAVTFVSAGTEANNLAVHGQGNPDLPILLAPVEHPSVLAPAEARGAVWWDIDSSGRARVAEVEDRIGMVALVHGQSEIGTLQPIAAAAEVARAHGVPLHVDVAQTLGRVPVDEVFELADSVAISSHKVGGLKGLAVLICRQPEQLRPLLVGGNHESGRRAGTPSPALASATALAIELAYREQESRSETMRAAIGSLDDALYGVAGRRLTPADGLPNTAMYQFDHVDGRNLLPALDLAGVEAAQGSACSTGTTRPPRVLTALGMSEDDASRCVRFSVGWHDSRESLARAGRVIANVVGQLQQQRATTM